MRNSIKNKKGYSLVELSLVVGIISILMLFALTYGPRFLTDYKVSAEIKRLNGFGRACYAYYGQYGVYPNTSADVKSAGYFPITHNIFKKPYQIINSYEHSIVVGMEIPPIEIKEGTFTTYQKLSNGLNLVEMTIIMPSSICQRSQSEKAYQVNQELGRV